MKLNIGSRISQLRPGQLTLLWVIGGCVSLSAVWTIATAPGEYDRAVQEAVRDDSQSYADADEARAAADSARQDLNAYALIRAHDPHAYWPFFTSDTMTLSFERFMVKAAKDNRDVNRLRVAAEQRRLDAQTGEAKWLIVVAIAVLTVVSWVWFGSRPVRRPDLE